MPVSTRKNAIYNVGYRMLSVLLPIVTAPYLARTVGQEGTGLYAYAWSISAIFVLLGMLGLENYGVRAIAQVRDDPARRNRVFSEIYQMQLFTVPGRSKNTISGTCPAATYSSAVAIAFSGELHSTG